ncbi:hypothetical protein PRIPAC_94451 [Pristionchus pacificus]|uniref:Uncharacterized protein n=1 Tax=Pristionchus pacificus TaxID=54126 RepID=A0A2A6CDA9_PRIPA|nr:hypothetical protein PRIPAC_94451 [Pristionchus pacificus]|eukprot:PDM76099.1 hypothetical protein PRIPAC_39703 [Pristionchus pacificus]
MRISCTISFPQCVFVLRWPLLLAMRHRHSTAHATTPVPWVTEYMHSGQQVFFVLPKSLPRIDRETVNSIVLRVYSFENLWRANARHALPSLYATPARTVDYAPVSIKVIELPFIVIGIFYACCILSLVAELLWDRFGPRMYRRFSLIWNEHTLNYSGRCQLRCHLSLAIFSP